MSNIDRHNIQVGQRYNRADGAPCGVTVIGLDRERDDVIVRHDDGSENAIDAWKLAVVRYYLTTDQSAV